MIKTLANAWKVADIRKKLLFTAFIVLVFRIGSMIPVPFLNIVDEIDVGKGNTILTYLSLMTGSAFTYGTIFAMSITPYINSSIIMQLLAVAIPALERLQKEGEEGRKKIASITRYVTVGLAILQSIAYFFYLRANNYLMTAADGTAFTGIAAVFQAVVIITVLTAGTAVIMWLGEQITIKGIGNGISIILFAGIVSRFPTLIKQYIQYLDTGRMVYRFLVPMVFVLFIAMIVYIVFMDNAERRLPIQYAKRVVGRKMYGGQSTNIPIKVAAGGVMPIIFASSIMAFPATIVRLVSGGNMPTAGLGYYILGCLSAGYASAWWTSLVYAILYALLILFFTYFYSSIQFNPIELANNMKKSGGYIPGIRPGKPTSDYIGKISSRLNLVGAFFLAIIAILPVIVGAIFNVTALQIGGTSLLIMEGVALETVRQIESQMTMRHYKGFLE